MWTNELHKVWVITRGIGRDRGLAGNIAICKTSLQGIRYVHANDMKLAKSLIRQHESEATSINWICGFNLSTGCHNNFYHCAHCRVWEASYVIMLSLALSPCVLSLSFTFLGVKICPHAMQTPQTQCCLLQINKGEARRVSDTSSSEQEIVMPAECEFSSKSWAEFGGTVFFCLLVLNLDLDLFIYSFICLYVYVCMLVRYKQSVTFLPW